MIPDNSRELRKEMEESFRLIDFLLEELEPCIKGYDARMNLLEVNGNIEKIKEVLSILIEDKDLIKNSVYRVKFIDPSLKDTFNRCAKMLWTGFYFKGIKTKNFFYLSQVEVIRLVETNSVTNDNLSQKGVCS